MTKRQHATPTLSQRFNLDTLVGITIVLQLIVGWFCPFAALKGHWPRPRHPLSLIFLCVQAVSLIVSFVWGIYLLCTGRRLSQRILAYLDLLISLLWLFVEYRDLIHNISIGVQWTWF